MLVDIWLRHAFVSLISSGDSGPTVIAFPDMAYLPAVVHTSMTENMHTTVVFLTSLWHVIPYLCASLYVHVRTVMDECRVLRLTSFSCWPYTYYAVYIYAYIYLLVYTHTHMHAWCFLCLPYLTQVVLATGIGLAFAFFCTHKGWKCSSVLTLQHVKCSSVLTLQHVIMCACAYARGHALAYECSEKRNHTHTCIFINTLYIYSHTHTHTLHTRTCTYSSSFFSSHFPSYAHNKLCKTIDQSCEVSYARVPTNPNSLSSHQTTNMC